MYLWWPELTQGGNWGAHPASHTPGCRLEGHCHFVSAMVQCKGQRRQWHPTPVLLPGKSHGRRSLAGCSPWGSWESDTTERLHFHFSLSCIEGNGNPLQYSCLKDPRDAGAWWAAIYGVAQSRTWLKRLSSSSSSNGKEGTLVGSTNDLGLQCFHETWEPWSLIGWQSCQSLPPDKWA